MHSTSAVAFRAFGDYVLLLQKAVSIAIAFVPLINTFVCNISLLTIVGHFCILEREETRSFELFVEAKLSGVLLQV